MDVNDIALIAPIEGNYNNLNNKTIFSDEPLERLYEYEAIRCFKFWRKNGGWLKDINIYTVCLTGNDISDNTKEEFKKLNVQHITDYLPESKDFSSGFLTIPYGGRYFEQNNVIKENYLIKIDLDQYLVKAFPKELIEKADYTTVIGQYSSDFVGRCRWSYENTCPFDTSLIITHKKHNFYKLYCEMLNNEELLASKQWEKIRIQNGMYFLEEFVIDYMYHHGIGNITPHQKYQFGIGYPDLNSFTDEEIKNIYLCHEHILINNKYPANYNKNTIYINYLRRLNLC